MKKSIELNIKASDEITYRQHNGHCYYTLKDLDKQSRYNSTRNDSISFVVYDLNTTTEKLDSFLLTIPYFPELENWSLSSISLNTKYIAVKIEKIYIFDTKSKRLIQQANYPRGTVSLLNDDLLFLSDNYAYHPADDSVMTKLVLYNIKTAQEVNYLKPHFDQMLFTLRNCSNIACSQKDILFSQSLSYDLKFFSTDKLLLKDSINRSALENYSGALEKLKEIQMQMEKDPSEVKEVFKPLRTVDESLNRIERVIFLNNDNLLVIKRSVGCKLDSRTLDVWTKKRKRWENVVKDQEYVTTTPKSDSVATNENMPFYCTYSARMDAEDNSIAFVTIFLPPILGKKYSDYKKYSEEYYSNHELNRFLLIYDWEVK